MLPYPQFMQKYHIEDIKFTYYTYKDGLELIGYAEHSAVAVGIIKAELLPRVNNVDMSRLVVGTGFRRIGIAQVFLTYLTSWGISKGASRITCVLMNSSMVDDKYEHLDNYLVNNGFRHQGLLLEKKLR